MNNLDFNGLYDLISKYDNITIFSHLNPDYDALGSAYGLKYLIEENFTNKKVEVALKSKGILFPKYVEINDEFIKSSLAIILDLSVYNRIEDQRFQDALLKVRLDHHPDEDVFDYSYANINYAATAELLTDFVIEKQLKLNNNAVNALYRGLLSDTQAFKTSNTTYKTLEKAAFLVKNNADIRRLNSEAFNVPLNVYRFQSAMISNELEIDDSFGYIIVKYEYLAKYQVTYSEAKRIVNSISNIQGVDIHALFVENEDGSYNGSLRSRYTQVSDVANEYNGGGHKNAAGVSNLTKLQVNEIIQKLKIKSQN